MNNSSTNKQMSKYDDNALVNNESHDHTDKNSAIFEALKHNPKTQQAYNTQQISGYDDINNLNLQLQDKQQSPDSIQICIACGAKFSNADEKMCDTCIGYDSFQNNMNFYNSPQYNKIKTIDMQSNLRNSSTYQGSDLSMLLGADKAVDIASDLRQPAHGIKSNFSKTALTHSAVVASERQMVAIARGGRLKAVRLKLELSRSEFAHSTKIKRYYLARLERGDCCLSVPKAKEICMKLHINHQLVVNLSWLLHGHGPDPSFQASHINSAQQRQIRNILQNSLEQASIMNSHAANQAASHAANQAASHEKILNQDHYLSVTLANTWKALLGDELLTCYVQDKKMQNLFPKGCLIFAKKLEAFNWPSLVNIPAVLSLTNGEMIVRIVYYDRGVNKYIISCSNLEYSPIILSRHKIHSIALVKNIFLGDDLTIVNYNKTDIKTSQKLSADQDSETSFKNSIQYTNNIAQNSNKSSDDFQAQMHNQYTDTI